MFSPVIYLMLHSLFFTLRLSGGGGSFPRPLKAAEEREYLERCAQGDLEARNILVEHNLRLVAHIVKKILRPDRGPGRPDLHRHHRTHQGGHHLQRGKGRPVCHLCVPMH